LSGDRRFADDQAIIAGFAKIENLQVAVIGHQKGRDTNERRFRNFGMPKPEGYRKALRIMELAEKFNRPVVTFIDTPGAYPGIDAEERGQAEAIAFNLHKMSTLRIPVISIVLGEGGSGGALALGVCDKLMMFKNAIYSVISPEGCAAILWKDNSFAQTASERLKLTANDLHELGIVDEIIEEGIAGLNVDEQHSLMHLKARLLSNLTELNRMTPQNRIVHRYLKLRNIGIWLDS
jgi:acetyl-CoA carboxylase carboxyl transferase subunit alpha